MPTSAFPRRRAQLRAFALAFLACALLPPAVSAAGNLSPDALWREVDEAAVQRNGSTQSITPQAFRTFAIDPAALSAQLARVPHEDVVPAAASDAVLWLPMPDGGYQRFQVVESPVMAPALAERYPELRTYLGQGIDDPTATLRFDLTPAGFRAQVLSASGTHYIDPLQRDDRIHHMAYRKRDLARGDRHFECEVEPAADADVAALHKHLHSLDGASPKVSSGATLRTYRLAMAATGEYTIFHGGTVADGLAAIVTTMNRVNGIYERELSVRMVLIPNNDLIVYTNPATDPYANTSGDLDTNISNINAVIGSANYDIGHLVGTGGGGVAGLGVVCGASKARGLTGSSQPVGDAFDVDYVAHEIGHQFAGAHTFDRCGTSSQRSAGAAYETGSGITIQAYAGICGSDNLQPNSEDYFHRISLNQMLAFTTTGNGASCGTTSPTGNGVPTVSTAEAFTIPGRTPFELSAEGSDPDGDALTYLWEQFDRTNSTQHSGGVLNDTGTGPMFRSFAPTTEPGRIFPSLRWILGAANVAPNQAPLPGTTNPPSLNYFTAERLSAVNRSYNFRVTVRDNRAGGGGTNEASTVLTVVGAAGPFAVTAPNTALSWAAGDEQTVTWNVANTSAAPISTANVDIDLSLDGGNTWPIALASGVPNSGSATFDLPAGTPASTQARVRVKAVGNIFFDVSDVNFSITGDNTAPTVNVTAAVSTRQGSPTATAVVASVSDTQDPAGDIEVSVSGAPPELEASVANAGGQVSLSATASCDLVAPSGGNKVYPLLLRAIDTDGAATTAAVNVNVAANRAPTLGTYADLSVVRGSSAQRSPSAAPADADGNLAAASVSPAVLPGGGSVSIAADGTVTVSTTAATTPGTYVLRPQANDICGAAEQRQFNVTVVLPSIAIVESGGSTVVTEGGAGDTYTIALTAMPSSTVSLQVTPDAQLSVSPTSLSFTTGNWNVPQTVTVNAVDDAAVEGPHTGTITHVATGGGYTGTSLPSLVVDIVDNEVQNVDLAVSNTRIGGRAVPGGQVVFDVLVSNLSASIDAFPAAFSFSADAGYGAISWTCVAAAGSSCPANGSGSPAHPVSIARGSNVRYTILATVGAGVTAGTVLSTTAGIGVALPLTDPVAGNNSASASATAEPTLVFGNGFESP